MKVVEFFPGCLRRPIPCDGTHCCRGGSHRTESRVAAGDVCAVSFTRSGCGLRRDGESPLSVLPETGRKSPHSRSRSQAATSHFHSSARRRSVSRYAGGIPKGRALRRVFCPAFSARAEKDWPSETKLLYKLWFIQSAQHFLPANAIQNLAINDVLC